MPLQFPFPSFFKAWCLLTTVTPGLRAQAGEPERRQFFNHKTRLSMCKIKKNTQHPLKLKALKPEQTGSY